MPNKLVIIDGNSLFYRSFYALPLLSNANGEYSNAVYGFAIQIVKIIKDIKPTHIAVAFDAGKHTFRNDMYSEYKATRKPMPAELRSQIEPLKQMLKLMNINICEQAGVEGDDIVGTLAKRFADTETIVVTADRDTLQLIDDTTKIYFTKKGTSELYIVDRDVLKRDFGVEPQQIIDLKALQGDKSDNIPGVAGIGEKSAQALLDKFGSLDGIYLNIDKITGKQKEKLLDNKDNAYLSYKLATIKTDVDMECSLSDCEYLFPFSKDVYNYFIKYDFKTLLKRNDIFADVKEDGQESNTEIININSIIELEKSLKNINNEISFYCDKNRLCYSNGKAEFVIAANLELVNSEKGLSNVLNKLFNNNALKIVFDSKHIKHMLADAGVVAAGDFFDLSIAKHLVDGISVKSANDLILNIEEEKTPTIQFYAFKDEYEKQLKNLGMYNLYSNVELPLVDVLFDMEQSGFKVDVAVLNQLSQDYKEELYKLENLIYALVGEEFNINSPKQLGEVLYDKLGLKGGRKKSTSADKLEALKDKHPVVDLILRYRKIAKLNSTYIEGLKPHLDKNNFVHTIFKQTLTNTGRLSSTEPNLQNIPIRTQEGKVVRSMFVASDENHVLIDADYSQIELRLLAHMSGDEYFVDAFNNDLDIHSATASLVYGVPPQDVTRDMRRVAKVVNFGIIYGISEYGLSTDLNVSPWEAKKLIDEFYSQHPKVQEFMTNAVNVARETGRVSTLLGRSRKMLEINSSNYMVRSMAERASQNMPLQGSAADIVKIAMVNIHKELKRQKLKAKLILQVHDELIIDAPKDEEEVVKDIMKNCMENAYKLKVPLTVDIETCYRWSDGH